MKRRDALAAAASIGASMGAPLLLPALAAAAAPLADTPAAPGQRVLRYAFLVAETGFDPAQLSDVYSITVTAHIFEGLYNYDHLARPPKVVPLVAMGLPEISPDFRVWTIKLQPGIFFADDADQIALEQDLEHGAAIDTSDLVNLRSCDGLPVREDGERFDLRAAELYGLELRCVANERGVHGVGAKHPAAGDLLELDAATSVLGHEIGKNRLGFLGRCRCSFG